MEEMLLDRFVCEPAFVDIFYFCSSDCLTGSIAISNDRAISPGNGHLKIWCSEGMDFLNILFRGLCPH